MSKKSFNRFIRHTKEKYLLLHFKHQLKLSSISKAKLSVLFSHVRSLQMMLIFLQPITEIVESLRNFDFQVYAESFINLLM